MYECVAQTFDGNGTGPTAPSRVMTRTWERPPVILLRTTDGLEPDPYHCSLVRSEIWAGGKHRMPPPLGLSSSMPFNPGANPAVFLRTSNDVLRFYVSQTSLDELSDDGRFPCLRGCVIKPSEGKDEQLYNLARALARVIERPTDGTALFADYAALAFHAHIIETYCGNANFEGGTGSGLAPWRLRRARELARAKLSNSISVSELATECGLSSSHFSRAFKQTPGTTPHHWLLRMRVEQAKELLRQTNIELVDIALACGFADQSHFSRVFFRAEGHTPGRWRRNRAT
jgi:AraC family transcriptional regulator